MKTKFYAALALVAAFSFHACDSDPDNTVDQVIENVQSGAVLRTINITDNAIPINIENGQTTIPDGAQLSMIVEEQDAQDGALLESVDIFVSFADGSPDDGDSSAAAEGEVFVKNVPAGDFESGPFGLPRTTITVTAQEMLDKVNLSPNALFGGDTFTTRFALNLTDGRVFTTTNAGGIITGGFFNSPFQYNTPVVCNLDPESFVGDYLIEEITPYVDGPTFDDGSVVEVLVGASDTERLFFTANYPDYCSTPNDFIFQFICGVIFVPFQESNCVCNDGTDFFGPAENPSNYDPNDDSVFFITFSNDTQSDCGPPVDTTYMLTKQ